MAMSMGSFATRVVATIVVATDGTGDTTDIQTGINLLPAGGGVVYVREGTYTITAQLTTPTANISLIGSGRSTRIEGDIAGNMLYINNAGVIINNIYFHRTGTALAGHVCIDIEASNCIISQCFFDNNGIGISLTGNDSIISANFIKDMIVNGTGIEIVDITDRNIVISNNIKDFEGIGIYLDNPGKSIVKGNICSNCAEGIITDNGTSDHIIEGNVCENNTNEGILIKALSDDCIILGNFCSGNDVGLEIAAASCDRNIVVANHLRGNTTTNFTDNGTNTQIGHNTT